MKRPTPNEAFKVFVSPFLDLIQFKPRHFPTQPWAIVLRTLRRMRAPGNGHPLAITTRLLAFSESLKPGILTDDSVQP
jgi:hypothetical protein